MISERRTPLAPPHSVEAVLSRPLHVIVRDYPETLAVLEGLGIRAGEHGGAPVARLARAEEVADALLDAVRWRPGTGHGGPS